MALISPIFWYSDISLLAAFACFLLRAKFSAFPDESLNKSNFFEGIIVLGSKELTSGVSILGNLYEESDLKTMERCPLF